MHFQVIHFENFIVLKIYFSINYFEENFLAINYIKKKFNNFWPEKLEWGELAIRSLTLRLIYFMFRWRHHMILMQIWHFLYLKKMRISLSLFSVCIEKRILCSHVFHRNSKSSLLRKINSSFFLFCKKMLHQLQQSFKKNHNYFFLYHEFL